MTTPIPTAGVSVRCMTPTCPWVGQVRVVAVDCAEIAPGVYVLPRLVCDCRTELDTEVVRLPGDPRVMASIPFTEPRG